MEAPRKPAPPHLDAPAETHGDVLSDQAPLEPDGYQPTVSEYQRVMAGLKESQVVQGSQKQGWECIICLAEKPNDFGHMGVQRSPFKHDSKCLWVGTQK